MLEKNLLEQNYLSSRLEKINQIYSKPLTFGSEIEFYLSDNLSIKTLNEALTAYNFEKERGKNQFEYHIGPYEDPKILIEEIKLSVSNIYAKVEFLGGGTRFDPKPFDNEFGNSLQIQFTSECPKFQDNIDNICASFCEYALQTFLAYASTPEDYKRFDKDFMAPTHVSFGPNNRSCLIRIKDSSPKRIEIRASSPVCNLYILICTILQQILVQASQNCHPEFILGSNKPQKVREILKQVQDDDGWNQDDIGRCNDNLSGITSRKHQKIYGLASDDQYNLSKLPKNIEEAEEYFNEKFYEIT